MQGGDVLPLAVLIVGDDGYPRAPIRGCLCAVVGKEHGQQLALSRCISAVGRFLPPQFHNKFEGVGTKAFVEMADRVIERKRQVAVE